MYTAPTALLSLVVLLPILAGLAALYYSHLNLVLVQQADQERREAARLAALVVKTEIAGNQTLRAKAASGNLTQADLEYLSGLATRVLRRDLGVPYSVAVFAETVRTNITLGSTGYEPSHEIVESLSYMPRTNIAHWSYIAIPLGRGLYLVVGCGV